MNATNSSPGLRPCGPPISNLPPLLQQNGLFCCWRYEQRPGADKPTKIPYDPKTGYRAKANDPSTFSSWASVQGFDTVGYNGIGVGIWGNIGAIDIDHCIDDNGAFSPMADDIMQIMKAYTELSPSGRGLRILFFVSQGAFSYDKDKYYVNNQKLGLEVYIAGCTSKFVTVTGNTLTPGMDLVERSAELQVVLDKYMVRPLPPAPSLSLAPTTAAMDDNTLIALATTLRNGSDFAALMVGDTSAYDNDHSRADLALCNWLAYLTGKNADQMDRIFRCSGLMRDKWDRPTNGSTYGRITIENAIANTQKVFSVPSAMLQPTPATTPQPTPLNDTLVSAADLQRAFLLPTQFLVDNMLSVGTSLLSAASKIGKSWLVLDMGLCIAAGAPFMGCATHQCGVLYLALEDSWNRLQDRMNKLLAGKTPPAQFYFSITAPTLDTGLLDFLDAQLQQHPEIKLIIIDTLQKIRGQAHVRESMYGQDYRELSTIKTHMDQQGVSVFFVHHNRKMKDDDDPFNMISGTNGIMGVADTIWVITKDKRSNAATTLHITGRDTPQNDISIAFTETWHWRALGNKADLDRQEYNDNPIVATIKKLLEESPQSSWAGLASDLMDEGRRIVQTELAATSQKLGYALRDLVTPLLDYDGILCRITKPNGTGGSKYHFCYKATLPADEPEDEEPEDEEEEQTADVA